MQLLMIKPIRLMSLAVLAATCAFAWQGDAALAQSGFMGNAPAELPPASYTGTQYVDSKGCVFVRAGVDGAVTWVPRVSRSRQQLCGAQPTQITATGPAPRAPKTAAPVVLPPARDLNPATTEAAMAPQTTARAAAPAAPAASATAPAARPQTVATVAAPRATVPRATAQPAPRVVMPAARQTAPRPTAPRPTAATVVAAPVAPVLRAPGPSVAPQPLTAQRSASPCTNLSPIGQAYVRPGAGVRCGPQAQSPVGNTVTQPARAAVVPPRSADTAYRASGPFTADVATPVITGQTRVVPRHVAAMQAQSADLTAPPAGYRPVWEDDRLNPRRAHQTLDGRAQMYLRWTRDVPQRLVDIRTGADVTAFNPDLVYPFVSRDAQRAAQQAAARGMRVVVVSSQSRQPIALPATDNSAQPRLSLSAPEPRVSSGAAQFVQVASFANPGNAASAAARLRGLGLPVAQRRVARGAGALDIVLAGPFTSAAAVSSALARARAAGFADAFVLR